MESIELILRIIRIKRCFILCYSIREYVDFVGLPLGSGRMHVSTGALSPRRSLLIKPANKTIKSFTKNSLHFIHI